MAAPIPLFRPLVTEIVPEKTILEHPGEYIIEPRIALIGRRLLNKALHPHTIVGLDARVIEVCSLLNESVAVTFDKARTSKQTTGIKGSDRHNVTLVPSADNEEFLGNLVLVRNKLKIPNAASDGLIQLPELVVAETLDKDTAGAILDHIHPILPVEVMFGPADHL